jgi:hypothetical protein
MPEAQENLLLWNLECRDQVITGHPCVNFLALGKIWASSGSTHHCRRLANIIARSTMIGTAPRVIGKPL